jgi:hypothetical protein
MHAVGPCAGMTPCDEAVGFNSTHACTSITCSCLTGTGWQLSWLLQQDCSASETEQKCMSMIILQVLHDRVVVIGFIDPRKRDALAPARPGAR